MAYSRSRTAWAVAQAVVYLALAGCGGGGDATDDSQAPQSEEQAQGHVGALVAPSAKEARAMTHSATVSWTAPVQNTDGTPLTDVAGYVISFGTSPTSLTKSIVVSDPGLTTGTVRALPAGTYYFSVATRNSSGALSNGSTVVSKTVP